METSTVDDEMIKEAVCRNTVIKCNSDTDILVPHFIDDGSNEEGCRFFSCNVSGVVDEFLVVGCFHAAADNRCGVVVNVCVVCRDVCRPGEGYVPCCGVGGGLLDDTDKVVCVHTGNAQRVVAKVVEEGHEYPADAEDVVACWLANDLVEAFCCHGKE